MIEFHLHLVSDATGDTLSSITKAALAQFETAEPIQHIFNMVRSGHQLEEVLESIVRYRGLVMFTFVDHQLGDRLRRRCSELHVPCVPVLEPVMRSLADYLGAEAKEMPGRQHTMNAEYFARIDAIQFCMAHDDGQGLDTLHDADVVLVGVSRTSKTPTCIYLANRGIKAANVPLVPGLDPPAELTRLQGPMLIGLLVNPDRLIQIRRNRLLSLSEQSDTEYVDIEAVRAEVTFARRYFARHEWPVIDVTRRSIEETAAAIIKQFER